jgi:hypothetical protein
MRKKLGMKPSATATWLVMYRRDIPVLRVVVSALFSVLFLAGLNFTGVPFDQALRFLLSNAGFFLPGESQKIDRLTTVRLRCTHCTFLSGMATAADVTRAHQCLARHRRLQKRTTRTTSVYRPT